MAHIEGEIIIDRPVEAVFDFVSDERNEPRFNRQMLSAEMLTPEPIGSGSRFRAEMRMMGGRTVDMTVEFAEFDRPRLLGSTTRSVIRGSRRPAMLTSGHLRFEPVPDGTRMRWTWQVETPGRPKIFTPLIVRIGRRQEDRIWGALKRLLEGEAQADI
jgi:uncharacterized protein YndB with AHSA1/START domain